MTRFLCSFLDLQSFHRKESESWLLSFICICYCVAASDLYLSLWYVSIWCVSVSFSSYTHLFQPIDFSSINEELRIYLKKLYSRNIVDS